MSTVFQCIAMVNQLFKSNFNGVLITVSGRAEDYKEITSQYNHCTYAMLFLSEVKAGRVGKIRVYIPSDVLQNMDVLIWGGQIIEVVGELSIYDSCLQISARRIRSLNDLAEYQQNEELAKLTKKELPQIIKTFAVITSENGAVYNDFVNNVKYGEVTLFQARMEGTESATDIISRIKEINMRHQYDVICIIRGGGGASDSTSFMGYNDANLAKAIQESQIPVLTAIGHHENSFLCDAVSDNPHFYSTPTAIAMDLAHKHQLLLANAINECTNAKREVMKDFPYIKVMFCIIALYITYKLFIEGMMA